LLRFHEWKEIEQNFIIEMACTQSPSAVSNLADKTSKNVDRSPGDEGTEAYPCWIPGFF
jgi:hypothetical protein